MTKPNPAAVRFLSEREGAMGSGSVSNDNVLVQGKRSIPRGSNLVLSSPPITMPCIAQAPMHMDRFCISYSAWSTACSDVVVFGGF